MLRSMAAIFLLSSALLFKAPAQTAPSAPVLEFTGSPMAVPYACDPEDLEAAGLACTESPCTVYTELNTAAGRGNTILAAGDWHGSSATLASVLLRSEDGGRTWRQPFAPVRGGSLDHIQMMDGTTAWISGETVQPLPIDPFFLLTTDAGKSWDRVPLFEEGTPGSILEFVFDSKDHGTALVDLGGGDARYEVWETETGGRGWSLKQTTQKRPKMPKAPEPVWRIHPEEKLFRLEHFEEGRWAPFASFAIRAASCKSATEPPEPKPGQP
jgi:hypothetical protein